MKMLYKIMISRGTINITSNHSKLMKNGCFEFKNSFTMRIRLLIKTEKEIPFQYMKCIDMLVEEDLVREK